MAVSSKGRNVDPEGLSVITDDETQLDDNFDGFGLEEADRRVQFGYVRTYKLLESVDPLGSDTSSESSDFELRSDALVTVDVYELGRNERASLRKRSARSPPGGRTNERANQWLESQRAEALDCEQTFSRRLVLSRLEEDRSDCFLQRRSDRMFQGSSCLPDIDASESSVLSNDPSDEWLEEHHNDCFNRSDSQDSSRQSYGGPLFQATSSLPDFDASESSVISSGPSQEWPEEHRADREDKRNAFMQLRGEHLSRSTGTLSRVEAFESSVVSDGSSEAWHEKHHNTCFDSQDKKDTFPHGRGELRPQSTDTLPDIDANQACPDIDKRRSQQLRSSSLPDLEDASESSLLSSGQGEEWLPMGEHRNGCFSKPVWPTNADANCFQ